MNTKFSLTDPNGPEIEIERSIFLGTTKVLVNGDHVNKHKEDSSYHILGDDGSVKKMTIKGTGFDSIPRIYLDGKEINIAKKLLWYEYLIAGFPMILIFVGGAIGGLCGGLASVFSFRVIRSSMSLIVKVLSVFCITAVAATLYFVVAVLFELFINILL